MRTPRSLAAALGVACLVLGLVGSLQNGTVENILDLGHVLLIAGAIIIAGALISSAIAEGGTRK